MRLLNILSQPVAYPVMLAADGFSSFPSGLRNQPILNVTLACGNYVAYWDGTVSRTGKEAPSGTYGVQLFIDNVLQPGITRVFHSK